MRELQSKLGCMMILEKPLVSIITVSLNSEETIRDTLESVLSQTYSNVEYIVVDGLSTDDTINIVESYRIDFGKKGYVIKIISESDNGLYDAMNKGIATANGSIIGILNSDDFYIDASVIQTVVDRMITERADCLYADLLFVDRDETSKVLRRWKANKGDFRFGWNPPHPTTFVTKKTYQRYGTYKTYYKISADYDFLYRIIQQESVKAIYLNRYVIKMRTGGKSTSGMKSTITGSKEIYLILKEYDQKCRIVTVIFRLVRKIGQMF